MKKSFSQEVMEKIEKGKIEPTKKWKINFKNNAYWFVLALLVLLSGAFFSLIVSSFVFLGPEIFLFLKLGSFFRILIFAAPYLWIFAFIICLVSGILIFQKTKTGYRHSSMFIASVILLIVSTLGVSAHFSKMNDRFEDRFFAEGPKRPMMMKLSKEGRLFMPKEGVLIGEIVMVVSENEFVIEDPMQGIWTIEYSQETKTADGEKLVMGEKVVIFGEKKEGNIFSAVGIKKINPNVIRRKDREKNMESIMIQQEEESRTLFENEKNENRMVQ